MYGMYTTEYENSSLLSNSLYINSPPLIFISRSKNVAYIPKPKIINTPDDLAKVGFLNYEILDIINNVRR